MLILLLLGLFLAYYVQKKVYERYWDDNLAVKVEFNRSYAYEGERCSLREEITNDKPLPLSAVEVRLGVSKYLEFSGAALENASHSDQSYRRDVFSLFAHQKIIRTLPFTCRKRGLYQITRTELVGSDFFFEREYLTQRPQQARLFVYPAVCDTGKIQLLCRAVSGSILRKNRLYPDPFEFSGIREYQKTDPMNHVNWKASARCGTLMVNQFDSTTSVQLTILLDTQDDGVVKHDSLTEEAIRIAASLAGRISEKNMDVYVKGNGVVEGMNSEEDISLFIKAGTGKMTELNQKLACINIRKSRLSAAELIRQETVLKKTERIYVLISANADQIRMEDLKELERIGNSIIWVRPVRAGSVNRLSAPDGVYIMQWEVEG